MVYVARASVATLYAAPSAQSERVDEMLCGMRAAVLDERPQGWLLVRTEYRYEGYMRWKQLAAPVAQEAQRMYINAFAADILVEPKVQAQPVACLTLGGTLYVSDRDRAKNENAGEGWSRVCLADGRWGYIRSTFLSTMTNPTAALSAEDEAALRRRITWAAKRYLGAQYRWGGKSPRGIDCSGLCFMAYWLNGITICRDARIMPDFPVTEIDPACVREGDLLFFKRHVAMALDDCGETVIHSSEAGNGVGIEKRSEMSDRVLLHAGSVFGTR